MARKLPTTVLPPSETIPPAVSGNGSPASLKVPLTLSNIARRSLFAFRNTADL